MNWKKIKKALLIFVLVFFTFLAVDCIWTLLDDKKVEEIVRETGKGQDQIIGLIMISTCLSIIFALAAGRKLFWERKNEDYKDSDSRGRH